ncbi:MAG TPA: terminase family protein [Candidatus Latescibacteria bacterium]|nr:MAG: Terminase-like family protein [Candidatus Latescibacteria bacterium ADurb.Bin168]HPU86451.1 terminase family protein [Candidatus Latescibacterota bacterium]
MTKSEARYWGAQLSPTGLAKAVTGGKYQRPPHIRLFDALAVQIEQGKLRRLVINVPPQHGKSEFWSKYFCAWYLGRHPDRKIIMSTYADSYAQSWSREARNILTEHGQEFYGLQVASDSSAVDWWKVRGNAGGMAAVGTGGQATGKGAHVFVCDDPVKGPEDAMSPTMQRRNVDWYRSVATTRLQPNGAIVVIQTRWDRDDLTGKLLNPAEFPDADTWTVISLPALALPGDLLGRQPGAALWPERYGLAELEEKRIALGSRWFEALYQQNPTDPQTGIFKREWFPIIEREAVPAEGRLVRYWDLAHSKADKHNADPDWTEGGLVKFHAGVWYVLDFKSIRDTALAVERLIQYTALEDSAAVPIRIEQEPSAGKSLMEHYRMRVLPGYDFQPITSKGSKVVEAAPVAAAAEAGNVRLVRGTWNAALLDQLERFPLGAHDDKVDVLSGAFRFLSARRTLESFVV